MSGTNPYGVYRQTAVETATPAELVVMLYDGAVRFLLRSEQAMQEDGPGRAPGQIARAQSIILELLATLDLDAGDFAQQLAGLYAYMYRRLGEASIGRDASTVRHVRGLLEQLRAAWKEAISRASQQAGLRAVPASPRPGELLARAG